MRLERRKGGLQPAIATAGTTGPTVTIAQAAMIAGLRRRCRSPVSLVLHWNARTAIEA
ncbi:MAG: hypothetical protein U0992_15785 [Planctomycetaceae bacterium]